MTDENAAPPTVPEADLQDLRDRLARTRWPDPWPGQAGWDAGAPIAEVRRLAEYWGGGFDWRGRETELRALPWRRAELDGVAVRFLLFEGAGPDPVPLLLNNGWPSTVLELVPLARLLAAGDGDGPAFTVVVPALPGFPGTPQLPEQPPALQTAELWHRLMRDVLGFERYGAQGGDLGAGTASRLAEAHPEAVIGLHLLAVADPMEVDEATVTADERAYRDEVARWFDRDGAYEHQQMTKPVTLAYGLTDSPVGLLAWLLEKYHDWVDRGPDDRRGLTDDLVLTQASLYWFANSIGTSFRPYFEFAAGLAPRVRRVDVPTAVALFPRDLSHPPRSWAERTYRVVRYRTFDAGGHFAAAEVPDVLADDIRSFFSDLAGR